MNNEHVTEAEKIMTMQSKSYYSCPVMDFIGIIIKKLYIIRSIPMFSIQKLGVTCLNVVKNVVPHDERILFQSLKNYRKHAH